MLTQSPMNEGPHRFSQLDDKAMALMFLFADSRSRQQVQSPCPSLETLANFIDRKLSKADRQRVYAHLEICPECHFHYQEVYSMLPWYQKAFNYFNEQVRNFIEPLRLLFNWLLSGNRWRPAAAVAFSVMLIITGVILYRTLFLLSPLEESYQMAFQQPQLVVQKTGTSPLAFSELEKSLAAQAFKAGLQVGQQRLLEKRLEVEKVPYDSAFTTQYQLGQWVALLQATALVVMTMPTEFWPQQYVIGEGFKERLQMDPQSNDLALTGLKPILEVLDKLRIQPSQQLGYQLVKPVKALIIQLSNE